MFARSVLILGGAGFVGTHLARQLSEAGLCSRIMSLDIQRPEHPVPRVIYNTHDVREPFPHDIDHQFDIVFNLAAVHRTPGHPDHAYYDTNVAGATNCIAFCERNGIDTIVFTSSISVYGPSEVALDETARPNPNSAYGRSKWLAEEIHRAWQQRSLNRQLRVVRPAVVFGQGEQGNYTRLARALQSGLFFYPGRNDTLKAGGYVKELVRTMLFALCRSEPYYLYNFADRHCPTAAEICRAFHEQGGMPQPLGVLPLPIIRAAAVAFEMLNALGLRTSISRERVAKLVYSTNIVPRRLIEDGYPFAYTLRSAIRDWVALDETIRPRGSTAIPVEVPAVNQTLVPPEPEASSARA